jgi:hypothetical protein
MKRTKDKSKTILRRTKLIINRETIAQLTNAQLEQVVGGVKGASDDEVTCDCPRW